MAETKDMALWRQYQAGTLTRRQREAYEELFRRGELNVPGAPQFAGYVSPTQMRTFAANGKTQYAPPPSTKPRKGLAAIPGRTGAVVRGVAGSALPTLAANVSGAAGALAGGAGGLISPVPVVTSPAFAIGGGIAGALAGGKIATDVQDEWLRQHPEARDWLGQSDEMKQEDQILHPTSRLAGEIVPSLATMKPSKSAVALAKGAVKGDVKGALAALPKGQLGRDAIEMGTGAAVGGGLQAAIEGPYGEGYVNPWDVTVAALAGGGATRNNRAGRLLSGREVTPLDKVLIDSRRKTGRMDPGAVERAYALKDAGVTPSLVDTLPDAALDRVNKVAISHEPMRAATSGYVHGVTTTTPTNARKVTRRGVPVAPQEDAASLRAKAAAEAEQAGEAAKAADAARPAGYGVDPGSGGAAVSERLSREYDESHAAQKAAFADAEATAPAFFEDLSPEAERPRGETGHWAPVEKDGVKGFMLPTGDFKPASEAGPLSARDVEAEVRKGFEGANHLAASDGAYPQISALIGTIKDAKSASDLYATRRRLSDVARQADAAGSYSLAHAARAAKKALDRQMDALSAAGRFTDEFGYPEGEAVAKWQNAIQQGREHAAKFRGNDIVETITQREYRTGAAAPVLPPEGVTQKLFGASPTLLSVGKNTLTDLRTLRDRLGADSQEWEALRQEGAQRILGAADPAKALAALEKKAPRELVDMIISPADRTAITGGAAKADAAAQVAEQAKKAVATTEGNIRVGEEFLSTTPEAFNRTVEAATPRGLREMKVGLRSTMLQALNGHASAAPYIAELMSSDYARANVIRLLGDEGRDMLKRLDTLAERDARARSISPPRVVHDNPGKAEQIMGVAKDTAVTGVLSGGHPAATGTTLMSSMAARLQNLGFSKASAAELAQKLYDPAHLEEGLARVNAVFGENAAKAILRRVRANTSKTGPINTAITRATVPADARDNVTTRAEIAKTASETEPDPDPNAEPTASTVYVGDGDADTADLDPLVIAAAIAGHEGTGDNPTSSAVGKYQFIDSTLVQYVNRAKPEFVASLGLDPRDTSAANQKALADKIRGQVIDGEPAEEIAMRAKMEDEKNVLAEFDIPATATTYYLAHFAGIGGLKKLLLAEPDTLIRDVLDRGAISSNANVTFNGKKFRDFTVADIINWSRGNMNRNLAALREVQAGG